MFGFGSTEGETFDDPGTFDPANIPAPSPALAAHDVLEEDAHVDMHEHAQWAFEEHGVYDVTFGYNLARLNQDRRHPDAGLRYARDVDDPSTLVVEFTPTTPFCPQGESLTHGVFRALTATSDRGDYESVRVRVNEMHNAAEAINEALERGAERYAETGSLEAAGGPQAEQTESPF